MRKILIIVLLIAFVGGCAGMDTAVQPQNFGEAYMLASGTLRAVRAQHDFIAEQVAFYYDAGLLSKEEKNDVVNLLQKGLDVIQEAHKNLLVARIAGDMQQAIEVDKVTASQARRLIRQAAIKYIQYKEAQ